VSISLALEYEGQRIKAKVICALTEYTQEDCEQWKINAFSEVLLLACNVLVSDTALSNEKWLLSINIHLSPFTTKDNNKAALNVCMNHSVFADNKNKNWLQQNEN